MLLICFGVVLLVDPYAGLGTENAARPPSRYPLQEVTVSVIKQGGNPLFGRRTGWVFGDGRCRYDVDKAEQHTETVCPALPRAVLLELLNTFYRIHFFDLKQSYTTRYRVTLQAGQELQMTALRLADSASTSVCLRLGDYQKCVTFSQDPPTDLAQLADTLWGLTAERAAPADPP